MVEVDGGGKNGIGEHEHEDHEVEPRRLEDTLEEERRQAARLVLIHRVHLPRVRVRVPFQYLCT